ncbi:hypothetical protein M513_14003 [Trichuris suis]|uniref:Uncharacterized protein n=1 Tax=Trichuris suis TaxID=68888 RepID=A0A085LJH4_9BILA|nr:hypothetical protein M513_14003 [Trichuris suis]
MLNRLMRSCTCFHILSHRTLTIAMIHQTKEYYSHTFVKRTKYEWRHTLERKLIFCSKDEWIDYNEALLIKKDNAQATSTRT